MKSGYIRMVNRRSAYKRPPAGQIQRRGSSSWEDATNRQQRKLTQVFDGWSIDLKRELRSRADKGATVPELAAILDAAIPRLARRLSEIQAAGVNSAVRISAKSRYYLPEIAALRERLVTENVAMIKENLVPRIHEKLTLALALGAAFSVPALNDYFTNLRSLPAQYSGGYWVTIFEVQKGLGKNREAERAARGLPPEPVRWVLDPDAEHCQTSAGFFGCPELAGEYPGGWMTLRTVPAGQVTCRGNCRCHVEVFRDGDWRRGVYAD